MPTPNNFESPGPAETPSARPENPRSAEIRRRANAVARVFGALLIAATMSGSNGQEVGGTGTQGDQRDKNTFAQNLIEWSMKGLTPQEKQQWLVMGLTVIYAIDTMGKNLAEVVSKIETDLNSTDSSGVESPLQTPLSTEDGNFSTSTPTPNTGN